MKVELKLTFDNNNVPCIEFTHLDRDSSIEQKALNMFIQFATKRGLCLKHTGGYLDTNNNSFEKYVICICD